MSDNVKVMTDDVINAIDNVIEILQQKLQDTNGREDLTVAIQARIGVLEWLKTGKGGKLHTTSK